MAVKHIEQTRDKKVKVNPYLVASLSPSFLRFKEGHGICGEGCFKPLMTTKYPFKMLPGWARGLFSRSVKAPVAFVCRPIGGAENDKMVNRTVAMNEPQPGDGMLSYTELAARRFQAQQAAEINTMIQREGTKMFGVTGYVLARGETLDDLRRNKDAAETSFHNTSSALLEHQLSNTQSAFWRCSPASLPDEPGRLAYETPMPAETLGLAGFFESNGYDDLLGIPLGDDGAGGNVRLDMHTHTDDRPNSNIAIVAPSGMGKSALMKHIGECEMDLYDVTFLQLNDIDGEYGAYARRCGGESSDPNGRLSPFEPRNITSEVNEDDDSEEAEDAKGSLNELVLANHIPFLKTYLQLAYPTIVEENLSIFLGEPITEIYKRCGITEATTFAEYYAGEQRFPDFRDLYYECLDESKEAFGKDDKVKGEACRLIAQVIRDEAIGYNAANSNSHERFSTSSRFVAINTSNLSKDPNIHTAQLYNILMWAWSQIRSRRFGTGYTRVAFDELGSIFDGDNTLAKQQISEMVRRARKYNAGVMFTFQGINSLLKGSEEDVKIGTTLLDNCTYKFFGAAEGTQPGTNLYQVQEYLHLTNEARDSLAKKGKKNFVVCVGKGGRTWLTTEGSIKQWELELFGKGGGQ